MARQMPQRLVMGPCIVEIDRIVIRDVQYQLEVNRCRNEEVNFQCSSAYSVGDSGQDERTDRQTDITTISSRLSKSLQLLTKCADTMLNIKLLTKFGEIWLRTQKFRTDGRKDGRTERRTDGQRQNNIPPPMAEDNKTKDTMLNIQLLTKFGEDRMKTT
ncbi:hypothetical protein DPMN_110273 [Dreissena polymorpha]|uniref:Uncharacterized protein n=1 Tax=Dreissena polymorpha TaxID=45954 RepID=A0A9D4QNQ8_DREPO|nr:hypothetical protein DPMN_110273 [Dreissena polymorpha]